MIRFHRAGIFFFVLSVLGIKSPAPAQIKDTLIFPNISFISPVGIYHPGDGTDRLFVLEQTGTIKVFPNIPTTTNVKDFLNLHDSISGLGGAGEMGLLGLAFHPQFASNGYFYVDYTMEDGPWPYPVVTRISRFQVSANPDSAIRTSELVLLQIPQPYENHKGGQLAFGPDGYLYIAMGDGGAGGDPENRAQADTSLLGKILRIDVNSASGGRNYSIPPTNPYADSTGKWKEIYAKGLRNPWRFSFDNTTLWAGDVGQNIYEEIDTIQNGKNYGWKVMEGFHCYNPPSGCNQTGLTLPVWEYDHGGGRCSITGGFVYRGTNIPQLTGKYIYGDYCSGQVWSLDVSSGSAVNALVLATGFNISSFGVDKFNELYYCDLNNGRIRKFKLNAPGTAVLVSPANAATGVSRTPHLIWRTTAWASAYRLQVSTDSNFTTTVYDDSTLVDTTKQIGPLDTLTKYYWRVRAKNSGGSGAYSGKRNFITLDDTVPPATPTLVSPANFSGGHPLLVTLRWTAPDGAATYRVQFSSDSVFTTVIFDDSTLIDTTRQTPALNYFTTYFWRVRAKNSAGVSAFSSAWRFTTVTPPPPPPPPTLISPPDGATDEFVNPTFLWYRSAEATSYRVQVGLDPGFGVVVADDSTITDTSWQSPPLAISTTHYWRVRAKNAYGTSAYSSVRSFTTAAYSASYHIQKGWNMVSLPLLVPDGKKSTLFPTSVSHAYKYAGSAYVISDSLIPGLGYWLKFADSQHVVISGTPILTDTVDIVAGWNMIGTITNVIPTDSTIQDPPAISNGTFFGYSSAYFQAASLQPSRGYWIKAIAPGKIIISSSGPAQPIAGDEPVMSRDHFMKETR